MPSESTLTASFIGPKPKTVLVITLAGAALLMVLLINSRSTTMLLAALTIAGGAIIWRAVAYTTTHGDWLICPLILTDLLIAVSFLPEEVRAILHYTLVALFCLPVLPRVWHSAVLREGGFKLYSYYFVWASLTILYSLAPMFSIGRLGNAMLVFAALTFVSLKINDRADVGRLLAHFLIGCGVVIVLTAASLIVLPASLTWQMPIGKDTATAGSIARFSGIFNGPNDVGELMLITLGPAAAYWSFASGPQKFLLGLLMALSLMAAALANSRTPFVALAIGGAVYLVWKYSWRAILFLFFVVLLLTGAHTILGYDVSDYLWRGDVATLTGRTDLWDFVLREVERRPLTGHGYEVAGAIFESRYFPLWWGPWDQGPHSSVHNGYLDHAISVGIPATLFWLFIMLRPWVAVFRRKDDPWHLKPIALLVVLPMLIHNLSEASIGDCVGAVGLLFGLTWVIAERYRIVRLRQEVESARETMAQLPSAVAALQGALVLILTLGGIAWPIPATAASDRVPALWPTGNNSTVHFYTLPPHAQLPNGAQCAAAVSAEAWEPRPDNYVANHTIPAAAELARFHAQPIKGTFAPFSDFARVDGQFTGTTNQILRWGACKWGIDEDVVRAEAMVESHWHQDDVGDKTSDRSLCPAGSGFPGAWDGASCWQSYGILQVKFSNFGGWPWTKDSTAFNTDFRWAYQRACMNGDIHYLGDRPPALGYPRYPSDGTNDMLWGCMGDWYSGSWFDDAAIKYSAEVKAVLAAKPWLKSGF